MSKKYALGILTGLLLPLFVAPANAEESKYTIRLGYYNCDHMTAAPVAEAAGIFKKMGLDVAVTGNGKVPEAMAAGQMDVGYVGITRLFRAFQKGAPILAAADNHTGGSEYLVVRKDSGITKPEDLIGKKVMWGATPDKTNSNWINYAGANNIPVDPKAYENYSMSDKDAYLAMKAGHLDAFDTCDPWGSMAVYEGTGTILSTFEGATGKQDGTCCVLSMSDDFVKNHNDLAIKMIQAHAEAIKFIYLHPKKSAEIFAKAYSVPEEVALMTLYRKTVFEGRTLNWTMDMKRVQHTADHIHKIGMIEEALDATKFADSKLYSAAHLESFDDFITKSVDPIFPKNMTFEQWKAKAFELAKAEQ